MQSNTIDLTVAICVYNGEKHIAETLNSLSEQTFQNFHLLVIDDCSTDSTLDIVRDFLAKHHWVSSEVATLPRNGGLARARKYAENVIRTDLVIFFDADDVAKPDMLEKLHAVLEREPDAMGVSGYCKYIDPASKLIGGGIYLGPTTSEEFFNKAQGLKLMFLPPATMFRLEVAKAVGGRSVDGFPEGGVRYQDMCEDLDLWTRMSDLYVDGKYFLVVPEILFLYRKHAKSVSSSSKAMNDRMRHIKSNLTRRRRALADQSFIEYMASLSKREKLRNFIHDQSSDYYKQAGFNYMNKNYFRFIANLGAATLFSPAYVLQKLQNNVLHSAKN